MTNVDIKVQTNEVASSSIYQDTSNPLVFEYDVVVFWDAFEWMLHESPHMHSRKWINEDQTMVRVTFEDEVGAQAFKAMWC